LRYATTLSRTCAPVVGSSPVVVSSRGMASEKQLKTRMKSVSNIKKITRAMKMVAAAKLRRSQDALEGSRAFAKAITAAWPDVELKGDEIKSDVKGRALIGITSDKGLCGAVNSVVIRAIKARLNALSQQEKDSNPPQVVLLGEKARLGLERVYKDFFVFTVSEQSKLKKLNFKQACLVADELGQYNFADSLILYNYFKNMISYETRAVPWLSFETSMSKPEIFQQYEVEGDNEFWQNFYEFRNAVRLYHYFAESETSELSSRMNAMGGSAKNAGEMLDKLRLKYNRTRQTRITTELIEIISGAVALEG